MVAGSRRVPNGGDARRCKGEGQGVTTEVPDGLFARAAVSKGLVSVGALRECLGILKAAEPAARESLADVCLRQGLLSRRDADLAVQAVAEGSVRSDRIERYEILSKIGEGGMGAVYAVMDTETFDLCAVKMLPKELADDEDIVKRFMREAEVACSLRHPNIVGGLRVGEDVAVRFFAMEFVDGETVYDRLIRDGVIPEGEALRIARGILLGLQYAADKGLVHRDIKPENIMIDRDGTPKLLDLGLVKRTDRGRASRLTQDGMAIGTPHYISPEQARGEWAVDARSDIYALGGTLYHLLTGSVPFDGNTAAVIMTKHLNEELDWPSDVNPDITEHTSQLISRMMAKERRDRYAQPRDVVADIDLIVSGQAPASALLPPGASSIRQAVHIKGAIEKASQRRRERAQAGMLAVHERRERRKSGSLVATLARRRRAVFYVVSGAVVAALAVALALVTGGGEVAPPAPAGQPDAGVQSPGGQAVETARFLGAAEIQRLLEALRATDPDELAEQLEDVPDPNVVPPDRAWEVSAAVRDARERFDREALVRAREVLDGAAEDGREARVAALEGLRRLAATAGRVPHSSALPQIMSEIARLDVPARGRPAPPRLAAVVIAGEDDALGWRTVGNWRWADGELVFKYDAGLRYSRAAYTMLGFGECVVRADLFSLGGQRADFSVWYQLGDDVGAGARPSNVTASAADAAVEGTHGRWVPLELRADSSGVRGTLGGHELGGVDTEGDLHNGRVRLALTGGTWRVRNVQVVPILADGRTEDDLAYEVGFADGDAHGWSGDLLADGLAARKSADAPPGAWARSGSPAGGRVLFKVTEGMRLALAFRANDALALRAMLFVEGGGEFLFRLSGRPPEGGWTALTVPLGDFRAGASSSGRDRPAVGAAVEALAFGVDGPHAQLVVSLVRVIK